MANLIQSVAAKTTLDLGESTFVQVAAAHPSNPAARVDVWIDGGLGASRAIRFHGLPGPRTIPILARTADGLEESTALTFDVAPPDGGPLPPFVTVYQVPHNPWVVELRVNSLGDEPLPFEVVAWDFGDSHTAYGPARGVTHDYWPSMDPDQPYMVFQVRARAVASGGGPRLDEPLTLTLWNPYFELKQRGTVRPAVRTDGRTRSDGSRYTGGFTVHNPERQAPVRFRERRFQFFFLEQMDQPAAWTPPQPVEVVVEPGEVRELALDLSIHKVPRGAHAVGVHLSGELEGTSLEARASAYFELYPDPARLYRPPAGMAELLDKARAAVVNPDSFSFSELRTLSNQAGLPWEPCYEGTPLAPLGPDEGEPCDPAIVCAEHNMVFDRTCQQLEQEEDVFVRGYFANAQKGDAVFSPGSVGVIGRLLGSLGQSYAHVGIMTRDQTELAHCTQSEDWLKEQTVGFVGQLLAALPTVGPVPTDGFEPDAVRFGWPGTVIQAADAAVRGSMLLHPGTGKSYCIDAFDQQDHVILKNGQAQLIQPMLARPRFALETPEVRRRLHRIADEAKGLKTHYRFFAYTDANVGNDPAKLGPDGSAPAVCSSLIWLAAQRQGTTLEAQAAPLAASDLEPVDKATQATVDAATLDGLYFYSEAQRRTAGEVLHAKIIENIDSNIQEKMDKAGAFGKLLGPPLDHLLEALTDLRDDVANQMCNAFAFDRPEDLSEAWRTPGDGRAVSPDNMLWNWDEPAPGGAAHGLYGDAEPLVYRDERFERRRRSVLRASIGTAQVRGRVVFENAQGQIEPVPGARVWVSCAQTATGPDGRFQMAIPQGDYELRAARMIAPDFYEGRVWHSYATNEVKNIGDVLLRPPPDTRRNVVILGAAHINEDDFPNDEVDDCAINQQAHLNQVAARHTFPMDVIHGEDETRGELDLSVEHLADHSVRVDWQARFFEGTSLDNTDLEDSVQGFRIVPPNGRETVHLHLENHEPGSDDWCEFNFTIHNWRVQ